MARSWILTYEQVREIAKIQRYLNRPSLVEIFKIARGEKKRRDRGIIEAVKSWVKVGGQKLGVRQS
jgi:hypothetical protein